MKTQSKYGSNFVQSYDPPYGVGVNHKMFIDCEKYVNTENFNLYHDEIMIGLSTMPQQYMRWSKFGGEMPEGMYKNIPLETEILSKELLSERDKEIISTMDTQEIRKYLYFSREIIKPWAFVVYLRNGDFSNKTKQHKRDWEPAAEYFPNIREFISELPFTSIGRVLFFCTDGFKDVPVHRDDVPKTHYDHGMNFFFDGGRKSYIYDPITYEKFYIDDMCRSYFFNNRDFHGVDAENRFRYTLRVDGTFNDDVIKDMKLYADGAVMNVEK